MCAIQAWCPENDPVVAMLLQEESRLGRILFEQKQGWNGLNCREIPL
jgi:hypothetical protein